MLLNDGCVNTRWISSCVFTYPSFNIYPFLAAYSVKLLPWQTRYYCQSGYLNEMRRLVTKNAQNAKRWQIKSNVLGLNPHLHTFSVSWTNLNSCDIFNNRFDWIKNNKVHINIVCQLIQKLYAKFFISSAQHLNILF